MDPGKKLNNKFWGYAYTNHWNNRLRITQEGAHSYVPDEYFKCLPPP